MKQTVNELISEDEIKKKVEELAAVITKDYAGKTLYMVCILKGGVIFMVDLARHIALPLEMSFMDVSSYGSGLVSSGKITVHLDIEEESLAGKDVLIVEDIVDSGRTLAFLMAHLKKKQPDSIKVCTFLNKPDQRVVPVKADYVGFVIPDEFVVGYGLDYDQKYRNLNYIGVLSFEQE